MKSSIKIIAIAVLFVASAAVTHAQQSKIGYIDFAKLVTEMPEYANMEKEMEKKYNEVEQERVKMVEEYQAAEKAFNEKASTYTQIVKQTKSQELAQMVQRIQNYTELAQQELAKAQQELTNPIVEKAKAAVAEVGKASGVTCVISQEVLVYTAPGALDLMPLVKKKLVPASTAK